MVRKNVVVVLLVIALMLGSFLTLLAVDKTNLKSFITNENNNSQTENQSKTDDSNQETTQDSNQTPSELSKFIEVYQKIQNSYVDVKSKSDLIDGAINGMVQSLNDPHSTYMDAKEAKDFFSTLSDSFEGIGAEVTVENGKITVIAPIKGSPSEKAGVQPKDQIIKVNGESLEGLNLFEAVSKIRGPKGTKAELEIVRAGTNNPINIIVVRDTIPIETIHYETINTKEGIIGKIEITNFGEKTAGEFKDALTKLESEKIKGLIIDLRGNPGGYLQSVLEIGNLVVPNNKIIVQIEDRNNKIQAYKSTMGAAKYPIVGLIDGGSASASEILAAALKEAGKYPLIGDTSYGKGTVQNPFELSDGSNLKLTVAKWLTSDGNWIHHIGVKPTIKIAQPKYYSVISFPADILLKYDMNNSQVQNLQSMLDGLGYAPQRLDGYFDKKTESAVEAFQKVNGLKADGIVDETTAQLLQDQIIEKIKDPKSDLQLQVGIETLRQLIK